MGYKNLTSALVFIQNKSNITNIVYLSNSWCFKAFNLTFCGKMYIKCIFLDTSTFL